MNHSKNSPFFLDTNLFFSEFINNQTTHKIWEQTVNTGSGLFGLSRAFDPEETGKYHYAIDTVVSEKLVGLSNNSTNLYLVPWELEREETYDDKNYLVFTGWADLMGGKNRQFEGHEIMIETIAVERLIKNLMDLYPSYFQAQKVKNIIGFESISF